MGSNQKQRCGSEFAKWYLYTRGVCGRIKAKQRWFKVTRELYHEWFHHVRHHVHDGHWKFSTVIWRLHCFIVSFPGYVRGESGPKELASVNWRTPQWARGQFTRTILPDWFEKWRDIKFWYMCWLCSFLELRCVSLIYRMMHKTCSIMSTWPIYKKHFLQLILEKENNFHLIKHLLTTFIFSFLFNLYLL